MCDVSLALAVGGFAMQTAGAITSNAAQQQDAKANARSAKRTAKFNSALLTERGVQETIAAAAQAAEVRRATVRTRGSLAASVAAAGLTGNTVDALDAELVLSNDAAVSNIERNLSWQMSAIRNGQTSEFMQMRDRISQVPRPSNFATGLEIAGSALSYFGPRMTERQPQANLPPE